MSTEYDLEEDFKKELEKVTDTNIKEKLLKMKELVVKRINLEKQFRSEQVKLEASYESKYAPLYKERNEIILGEKEINASELKDVLKGVDVDSLTNNNKTSEKGVPDYWLTCLKNSAQFGEVISSKDEEILKHLKTISLEYLENGDFVLNFAFNEDNGFFTPATLSKKFIHNEKQTISKIESTTIEWTSPEKNPTVSKKKKNVKNSKTKEVKSVVKTVEVESFFNFFKTLSGTDNKSSKLKENTEEDEEEYDENDLIEEHYETGVFVKDELIPYSLEYYLDLVDEEDLDDEEDEEEDEDGDDDDEDEKKPKKSLF